MTWLLITDEFIYRMKAGTAEYTERWPVSGKTYRLPPTWLAPNPPGSIVVDLNRKTEPKLYQAPIDPPSVTLEQPIPLPAPPGGIGLATTPVFWPQTDNFTQPDRTCNSSATAMALKALGYPVPSDDDFLRRVIKLGDTTDHNVVNAVCRQYGAKPQWLTNMTFTQLDVELQSGRPVVIGILHRGPVSNPTGGHMIMVWRKEGHLYRCHDPYGSMHDNYTGAVINGRSVLYDIGSLRARWTVEGDGSGWGRVFR